jgi:hypothetical protein
MKKLVGLLFLAVLVSSCGKNSKNVQGGGSSSSSTSFNPIQNASQSVQDLQNQLQARDMRSSAYGNARIGSNFTKKNYIANTNTQSVNLWIFDFNYTSNSMTLSSTDTYRVSNVDSADQVTTDRGIITRSEVLNKIFHPETTIGSSCSISVQNVQLSGSQQVNLNFTILENCSGTSKYYAISTVVDLNLPLFMNPVRFQQSEMVGNQMLPKKSSNLTTFGL